MSSYYFNLKLTFLITKAKSSIYAGLGVFKHTVINSFATSNSAQGFVFICNTLIFTLMDFPTLKPFLYLLKRGKTPLISSLRAFFFFWLFFYTLEITVSRKILLFFFFSALTTKKLKLKFNCYGHTYAV